MGALQAFVRVGGRGTLWLLGLTLGLEVLLTNTLCNRDLVDGTVITRSCSGLKDAVCVNDTVGYILTHPGTCAKKNGVFGDTITSACLSFTLRTDCEGYTYRPPQNLPACDWTPSINTTEYGHSCFCPQGFGGPECEDDLNECWSQPCLNGGVCVDSSIVATVSIFAYRCACSPGWEGGICAADTDECVSNPCQNGGSCVESNVTSPGMEVSIDAYACACTKGFEGINCEVDIDECSSMPCVNGGSCRDSARRNGTGGTPTGANPGVPPGWYRCYCAPGWEGQECTYDSDECLSAPCVNGGECLESLAYQAALEAARGQKYTVAPVAIGIFRCDCKHGWEGPRCNDDVDECSSGPCYNGESQAYSLPSH
jgi:Notch-like protein